MPPMSQTLADLPAHDEDRFDVVIETQRGGPDKHGCGHAFAALRRDAALPEGVILPFGYVPSTVGEDGAPLDALVFIDAPPPPIGCAISFGPIGGIGERRELRRAHDSLDAGMARAAKGR